MRFPDAVMVDQVFFEDVTVGDKVPEREYGPHTLTSGVFWAAVQENTGLLHFDREHVRAHRGAKSIVVSGQQRQALLCRTVLDWAGPRGFLREMDCRHRSSTYEGDMQIYSGEVIEKSSDPEKPWVVVKVYGRNQDNEEILNGKCTVLVPPRNWPVSRHVWEVETP